MGDLDLDTLERLAQAMTAPGPWSFDPNVGEVVDKNGRSVCAPWDSEQGPYLAAVDPVTVLELVAQIRDGAALTAFNAIAELCGCPKWDYPGQVVRDVERLVAQRDAARTEVEQLRRLWAGADCKICGWPNGWHDGQGNVDVSLDGARIVPCAPGCR